MFKNYYFAYHCIVVFGNVTDYNSNFQFVSHGDEYGYKA
ncbi:DUF2165 family protein [Campylobacter jejuni]|nr:DUF2165 family protein [Campylobacter jejuni]ELK1128084.1 DUF2165 family protein [Campylobacter jejuni]